MKHAQKIQKGKVSKIDQTTSSTSPQKKKSPYAVYRSTLKTVLWLEETYPRLFNTNHPKPLAKGVTKHLLTQGPFPHSNKRIRQGVWLYTNFKGYHEAIVTHTHRYTLEGEVSEPITDDEKAHSQEILTQRQQKTRTPTVSASASQTKESLDK